MKKINTLSEMEGYLENRIAALREYLSSRKGDYDVKTDTEPRIDELCAVLKVIQNPPCSVCGGTGQVEWLHMGYSVIGACPECGEPDLHKPAEEPVFDSSRLVPPTRKFKCPACNGTGFVLWHWHFCVMAEKARNFHAKHECPVCHGTGICGDME